MKTNITLQPTKGRPGSLRRTVAASALAAILSCGSSMTAAVLRVPADYPTIQSAVDAAAPTGDEILIAPGVYNEQVFINGKALTITGTNGTVLSAWTGMKAVQFGPIASYDLMEITTNADVVVRHIDFEGNKIAHDMPISPAMLEGIFFWGASGRVENCTFAGFRGQTNLVALNGGLYRAYGLTALNPVPTGAGIVNVQLINNVFTNNGYSIFLCGEHQAASPNPDPSLLRMTFVVAGNTIAGVGPTTLDVEFGLGIAQGTMGLIRGNRISGFYYAGTAGYWSMGVSASSTFGPVPLKPLRFEENTFVGNQDALDMNWADNSQIINNVFQGRAGTWTCGGLYANGTNVAVALNQFTNLDLGIDLFFNDPWTGPMVNPTLLANRFCNVGTPVYTDPGVVGKVDLGSQFYPFPPPACCNLTCSPSAGGPGTHVHLEGTNLLGAIKVLFNGRSAAFTNMVGAQGDRLILATVPEHATTGPITVITPQGNITSLAPFTVPILVTATQPAPGQVQLSWTADACDMLLETSPDLVTPNWQTICTSPSVGTNLVTWTGPQPILPASPAVRGGRTLRWLNDAVPWPSARSYRVGLENGATKPLLSEPAAQIKQTTPGSDACHPRWITTKE